MQAGASYVCPLVGRLQDQGHDALSLVEQCVFAVDHYGYDTKVMFSSVRTAEHVRNALNLGVHTITAPWKIMKALTENNFTTVGTEQFVEHTRLMTVKVKNVVDTVNPTVTDDTPLVDAIVKMTEFGFGAVTVVKKDGTLVGVFTDGDLRRKIQQEGRDVLKKNLKDFEYGKPVSIEGDALLNDANALFKKFNVDTLLVTDNGKPVGMLDIQDMRANAAK